MAERLSKTYDIRWTALDWLLSYLCYRPQTILFDWVTSVLSAVVSLRAPCSDRGCSCSTRVNLLPLSVYMYLTSTLYTRGPPSTVAQQRRRMELGVERTAQHRRVPTDCGSTPKRRTSYGVQAADGISIVTLIS